MKPAERFEIMPCEDPDHEQMFLIWDRVEQQVIDVLTGDEAKRYSLEPAL